MTARSPSAPLRWARVLRLARAAAPTKGVWDIALLALLVVFLTLYGLVGMDQDHKGRHLSGLGMIWFVLLSYMFHIGTGLANRAWRVLPVSLRERRAAAWVLVAVLPLLLDLAATLGGAVIIAALEGDHTVAQRALSPFGLRGMAMESYAALALGIGNWPSSAAHLSQLDRRQLRDWLLLGAAGLLCVALAIGADPVLAAPAAGPWMALGAIALCAGLLPVAQRCTRLDAEERPGGAFDRLTSALERRVGLRLGGWSGHFARQAVRTAGLWAVLAGFVGGFLWLVPAPVAHGTPDAAFREGMRVGVTFGTATLVWFMPAMAGALIAIMTQQYLLRARLMLLTLPHGALLMMITPLFNAALAFAATLVLVWPHLETTPGWQEKLAVGGLYALSLVHLALACNLRSTRHVDLLANGLVLGVAGGGTGFFGSLAAHDPQAIDRFLPVIGLVSLVVLIVSLVWCGWSLRHSRAPYRPWPGTAGGWRAA